MGRILIVDDDRELTGALSDIVRTAGQCPETAYDGASAIETASTRPPDAIVVGIGPSDEICRSLRKAGVDAPVLVISAAAETSQKVRALDAGADDFVAKPFEAEELVARIRALVRRYASAKRNTLTEFRVGMARVDFVSSTVTKAGVPMGFSAKEIQLLRFLIERRNCIVSRDTLLKNVWGYVSTDTRTVDVHIATIRQKLEDNSQQPRFIVTVRGKGYMFCD